MGKYGRDIFHNASWNQNEKILQFFLDYAREDWGSPELLKMDNDGMNIFIMLPLTEMRKSCNCSSTSPERKGWGDPELLKMNKAGRNIFHRASRNENKEILQLLRKMDKYEMIIFHNASSSTWA